MKTAGLGSGSGAYSGQPLIRHATFEDYQRITDLHDRNGLRSCPGETWERLWTSNPAYAARPDWPLGWVRRAAGGDIVGSISCFPASSHWGGGNLAAASVCAWVVAPPYRRFSLSLLKTLISR